MKEPGFERLMEGTGTVGEPACECDCFCDCQDCYRACNDGCDCDSERLLSHHDPRPGAVETAPPSA